jgi:hypothetical protein
MGREKGTSSLKKSAFLGCAGAIFIAAFFATYFSIDMKLFYIPGIFWNMPLPVIYWSLGFLYAYVYMNFFKMPFGKSLAGIARPWFLAQLTVLLVDLKIRLAADNPLNRIYLIYIWAVMLILFCLTAYLAGRSTRNSIMTKRFTPDHGFIYLMSFISLSIYLLKSRFLIDLGIMLTVFAASFFLDFGAVFRKVAKTAAALLYGRKRFLIFLYFFALIIRCLFSVILIEQTAASFPLASCDGDTYDRNGMLIAESFRHLFDGSLCFRVFGPYYWVFIGMIYKIFGHNFYAVSFTQDIIASFLAPIVYLITLKLSAQERISRLAGVITALCMSLIYLSAVLQPESLMITLLFLFAILLTKYNEGRRGYLYLSAVAGVVFGLMNGVRSIMVLFPVFMIPWFFFFVKKISLRTKVISLILFGIIAYMTIYPAEFMYSRCLFGRSENKSDLLVISQAAGTYQHLNPELDSIGFNPFSNPRHSIATFLRYPGRVSRLFARSALLNIHRFFFINFFGYFNPFVLVLPSKYYNPFGAYALFYIYAGIALGAIRIFVKNTRNDVVWLLAFMFMYYILSHPIFFEVRSARYRAPIHPIFIIAFAVGIFYILDWLRKEESS